MIVSQTAYAQQPVVLSHRWESDPALNIDWYPPEIPAFPFAVDVQRIVSPHWQASVAEARKVTFSDAKKQVTNRAEAFSACLDRLRDAAEANPQARRAILSAALALAEGKADVEALWQTVEAESVLAPLVEPALITSGSNQALSVWRERIAVANRNTSQLLIAIEGIGLVGDTSDRPLLLSILSSGRMNLPTKLAAARALGELLDQGQEDIAAELHGSGTPLCSLLAASVLRNHRGSAAATKLLVEIASGDEAVSQAEAYRSLSDHAPEVALEMAPTMLGSADPTLRELAVAALNQSEEIDDLRLQGTALADENVRIRRQVRENLQAKSHNNEFRAVIEELILQMLDGDAAAGIEQAILLADAIQDDRHQERLVSLLSHPDDPVSIRAAWSLKTQSLSENLLVEIHQRCQRATANYIASTRQSQTEEYRVSFLIESLGENRYEPAREMLLKFVPKHAPLPTLTRVSAVYALGRIYEGQKDEPLAQQLMARAADNNELDPEDEQVRYAASIAVGRIGVTKHVERLQSVEKEAATTIALAAKWGYEHLMALGEGD
ncbi:MAG: hypothetical protein KDB22_12400 [Planctomycetales bacterium]|nr:hypothetical protein [Planctomycetales bacterium]